MNERLTAVESKVDMIYAMTLENNELLKAQVALQPGQKEQWEAQLNLKWSKHEQVETVFEDATLVSLLKVYVKMFIPSGKILDFHKTFYYGLMTKSLFGRSFVDDTG
jgi:hypothetical protein